MHVSVCQFIVGHRPHVVAHQAERRPVISALHSLHIDVIDGCIDFFPNALGAGKHRSVLIQKSSPIVYVLDTRRLVRDETDDRRDAFGFQPHDASESIILRDILGAETCAQVFEKTVKSSVVQRAVELRAVSCLPFCPHRDSRYPFPIEHMAQVEKNERMAVKLCFHFVEPYELHTPPYVCFTDADEFHCLDCVVAEASVEVPFDAFQFGYRLFGKGICEICTHHSTTVSPYIVNQGEAHVGKSVEYAKRKARQRLEPLFDKKVGQLAHSATKIVQTSGTAGEMQQVFHQDVPEHRPI